MEDVFRGRNARCFRSVGTTVRLNMELSELVKGWKGGIRIGREGMVDEDTQNT